MRFPEDTLDEVEQLFADKVLILFPQYGDFWEEFIGRRLESNVALRPYGLKFASIVDDLMRSKVEISYNRLVVRHYSLFCELAGAHYQQDETTAALLEMDVARRHFLFWESFCNFYQHLGNARNLLRGIWIEVCEITNKKETLEGYLTRTEKRELRDALDRFEREVITIRDNLVHSMRSFSVSDSEGYMIPLPIIDNPEPFMEPKQAIDASTKMRNDINKLEELLNKIEPLFAQLLRNSFSERSISIDK